MSYRIWRFLIDIVFSVHAIVVPLIARNFGLSDKDIELDNCRRKVGDSRESTLVQTCFPTNLKIFLAL